MRKSSRLVEGVGITDVSYSPVATKCPYYRVWQAMLKRCYSARSLQINPTYLGCSVAPEWHRLSVFRSWMEQKDWQGKSLDKDLLVPGNKVYGPTTCLFVSQQINTLISPQKKLRGSLPIGVNRHGDKFKVTFKKLKITRHIGVFDSVEEAAAAYLSAKAEWIIHLANQEQCALTRNALIKAAQEYRKGLF